MDKKYTCILIDPPWEYRNKNTGGSMKSGARTKYPTLSLEELSCLNIKRFCAKDCVLWLWTTTPMLPEAFPLMERWGFAYKTAIYWRKVMSLGMGFWFRGQVEVLLMGIRGNVKAFHCQQPNFIQSKARKHSQKPEESYKLIESVCPGPRLELFAREKREGWDAMGLEVNGIDLKNKTSFSPEIENQEGVGDMLKERVE